jgi:hypothetical protein
MTSGIIDNRLYQIFSDHKYKVTLHSLIRAGFKNYFFLYFVCHYMTD